MKEKTTIEQLREYYNSLPENRRINPRVDFLRMLSEECKVSYNAAWCWVCYDASPSLLAQEKIQIVLDKIKNDNQ